MIGSMERFLRLVPICFLIIAIGVNFTSATCNGYSVELLKAENCPVNGTIAHTIGDGSTAFMTEDCDMIVRICGETIGFNTNVVKMSVQRNGIKFYRGKLDFCELLDYQQSDSFISIKANEERLLCPVKPGPLCIDYMFGTGKYQAVMRLIVGKYEMKFDGTYDTGKACSRSVVNINYTKPTRAPQ